MPWWGWVLAGLAWLSVIAMLNKIADALERAADQSTHIAIELTQMVEAWERWEKHDRP